MFVGMIGEYISQVGPSVPAPWLQDPMVRDVSPIEISRSKRSKRQLPRQFRDQDAGGPSQQAVAKSIDMPRRPMFKLPVQFTKAVALLPPTTPKPRVKGRFKLPAQLAANVEVSAVPKKIKLPSQFTNRPLESLPTQPTQSSPETTEGSDDDNSSDESSGNIIDLTSPSSRTSYQLVSHIHLYTKQT